MSEQTLMPPNNLYMRYVKTVQCSESLSDIAQKIASRVIHGIVEGRFIENLDNRVVTLGIFDTLRVVASIETTNNSERIVKQLLARACYHAEQSGALASFLLLCELAKNCEVVSFSQLQKSHLKNMIDQAHVSNVSQALLESLELGGAQAMLGIRESERSTHIVVTDSIEVPVTTYPEFGNDIILPSCRILAYDGVIEKVSEINATLELCLKSEAPLILYSRGYGYEVVSTLLHNWRAGKLRVIPVAANSSDLQNFWFIDLPTLGGAQSIVTQPFDELETFSTVRVESNALSIVSTNASLNAMKMREKLREEANHAGFDRTFVDERLRRLSSRKVEIVLGPEFGNSKGIYKDRFGTIIRAFLGSRQSGITSINVLGRDMCFPLVSSLAATRSAKSLLEELDTKSMVVCDV